jgi:hypothetical protein
MKEPIPGFSLPVFKWSVAESLPFLEQCCGTVLVFEISAQSFLKAAAKDHASHRDSGRLIRREPGHRPPPKFSLPFAVKHYIISE